MRYTVNMRLGILGMALLLMLSGCSSAPAEVLVIDVADLGLAAQYTSDAVDYTVRYPDGWSVIDAENAAALLDDLSAEMEVKKLREMIETARDQGFVFLVDDSLPDLAVNFAVAGMDTKATAEKYLGRGNKLKKTYVKSFPDIVFAVEPCLVDLGRGADTVLVAFSYSLDGELQAIRQYATFVESRLYTVTLTCPGERIDDYAALADAVAASLTVDERAVS